MGRPNSRGGHCFDCVRVGQLPHYSRVLLLPLDIPPMPAPAMLQTKSSQGNAVWRGAYDETRHILPPSTANGGGIGLSVDDVLCVPSRITHDASDESSCWPAVGVICEGRIGLLPESKIVCLQPSP